jgi:uncharacterized membrane protein/thiol-disulfide isomerase/thioredoxin
MRKIIHKLTLYIIPVLLLVILFYPGSTSEAQTGVVNMVLFFSPSCPHCEQVITTDLPPLIEKYGEQINIIGINTSIEQGSILFQSTIDYFQIPEGRIGVPTLVIGDTVLVGGYEIPTLLPGLIDQHLANGGADWPAIPGLSEIIEMESDSTNQTDQTAASTEQATWITKFQSDPLANTLAVSVLILLAGVTTRTFVVMSRKRTTKPSDPAVWVIPSLAIIGLVVATYLSFVETTDTIAICGPVGDCNTVQQSKYATLFGILPIGILGLIGYVAILSAWILGTFGHSQWTNYARLALFGMALFGTLFSIYLTFLEPFVIGATCLWCITSAVIMASLLWATTPSGIYALQTLFNKSGTKPTAKKNSLKTAHNKKPTQPNA